MSANGIVAQPARDPRCPACGAPLPADARPLDEIACPACGKRVTVPGALGQYRLVRLIGAGGMGAVYEALDEGLQRRVAVKVILREKAAEDPAFIENFRREAQAAAKLQNPHIVAVYAFGEAEGQPFLVMELVRPDSLDRMMKEGPVLPATALNVGLQVAQGLKAAAEQKLVHGDVKPENILINDAREAKLADFGIAALMGAHAAAKNEVWGTPYYIAPETLRKQKVDLRADIYSLGGTLYHAIAGVPPFEGADAVEVMKARLIGPPRPLAEVAPGCPEPVAKIVMRMLEPEPIRRYPNYDSLIADMAKELRAAKSRTGGGKRIVIKGAPGPSRPMQAVTNPNSPLIPEKPGMSKKAIIGLSAGLGCGVPLLVAGALTAIVLSASKDDPAPPAPTNAVAQVAMPDPAAGQARADALALAALSESVAARAATAKAAAAEGAAIAKTLAAQARRAAVLPEHEAWLEPCADEPPVPLFRDLQEAFALRDALAAEAEALEKCRATVDGARAVAEQPDTPPEAVAKALADAKAALAAHDASDAAKAAKGAIAKLRARRAGWRAAVGEGRAQLEAQVKERHRAEEAARRQAAEAEEAARREAEIAREVASVAELEAAVSAPLDAFLPAQAAKAFAERAARLRSAEAKAAAETVAERFALLEEFQAWLVEAANAGTLAACGITAADAEGATVAGERVAWRTFAADRQGAAFRAISAALADDQGARALSTARRSRLAVAARLYVNRYFGEAMLSRSPSLRATMERLRAVAERLPATRALLGRVEGAPAE